MNVRVIELPSRRHPPAASKRASAASSSRVSFSGSAIAAEGAKRRCLRPRTSREQTTEADAKREPAAEIHERAHEEREREDPRTEQRELPAQGEVFIAATGGPIAAGQSLELEIGGIPHHSRAPRTIALALAGLIVAVGVWMSGRPSGDSSGSGAERKRLVARRDRLFNDLVRLEHDHRGGRGDERRYATRREEILAALEQIYGALDGDDTGPEPADRTGLAA